MKRLILMGFTALLFSACSNSPQTVETNEANEVAQADESALVLNINTEESIIEWTGEKHLGKQHHGTINLSGGTVSIENGFVTAGDFVADMTTIHNLDLPTEGEYNNAMLEGHLMSPEFFDVENNPTATFHITSVNTAPDDNGNTHNISGNMTIRGVSKEITFPAKVEINESGINAVASFHINRLDWGVSYDEEGIQGFIDGVLKKGKDDFVKDEIGLTIKLVAN